MAASRVQHIRSTTGMNVNSHSRVSNFNNTSARDSTVSNNHVLTKQMSGRSRGSQNEARLNETEAVQPLAGGSACKKSRRDGTLMDGRSVSAVVLHTQNQQSGSPTVSHFDRHVNGFEGVADGPSMSQQIKDTRKSFVSERRLERPGFCTVTSHSVTSSTTSGSGPLRPVTSRVSVIPVRARCNSQPTVSGPSVDRSWETLRTDSTRAAVIPHKTTVSPRVSTAGPQDKTAARPRPTVVIPVQQTKNTGHRRLSAPQTESESISHATHTADHCVGSENSECGCGQLDRLDVVVQKTRMALGFSTEGGKDPLYGDRPITVNRVFRGKRVDL